MQNGSWLVFIPFCLAAGKEETERFCSSFHTEAPVGAGPKEDEPWGGERRLPGGWLTGAGGKTRGNFTWDYYAY